MSGGDCVDSQPKQSGGDTVDSQARQPHVLYLYSLTLVDPALSQTTGCVTQSPTPEQKVHSVSWIGSIWSAEACPETGRSLIPSTELQAPKQTVISISLSDQHASPSDVLNVSCFRSVCT